MMKEGKLKYTRKRKEITGYGRLHFQKILSTVITKG